MEDIMAMTIQVMESDLAFGHRVGDPSAAIERAINRHLNTIQPDLPKWRVGIADQDGRLNYIPNLFVLDGPEFHDYRYTLFQVDPNAVAFAQGKNPFQFKLDLVIN
jgi:hypothetical protein